MRIFFFEKKKWGAIDRKLFNLPRSKILYFHFFSKNLEKFDWGHVQRENGKKERRFSSLLFMYEKGHNFKTIDAIFLKFEILADTMLLDIRAKNLSCEPS